jgi:tellurite methyltransferase
VLKPKALYQGTMLPTRNINYGQGRTVAPDTFVRDRAEEPGHPHFYCDASTLVALFAGFELLSLSSNRSASPVPGTGTSSPNAGWSRSATLPYSQHN